MDYTEEDNSVKDRMKAGWVARYSIRIQSRCQFVPKTYIHSNNKRQFNKRQVPFQFIHCAGVDDCSYCRITKWNAKN